MKKYLITLDATSFSDKLENIQVVIQFDFSEHKNLATMLYKLQKSILSQLTIYPDGVENIEDYSRPWSIYLTPKHNDIKVINWLLLPE